MDEFRLHRMEARRLLEMGGRELRLFSVALGALDFVLGALLGAGDFDSGSNHPPFWGW